MDSVNFCTSSSTSVYFRMLLSNRGSFVQCCNGATSRSVSFNLWQRGSWQQACDSLCVKELWSKNSWIIECILFASFCLQWNLHEVKLYIYSKKNMFLDKLRKNANYMYFDNFVDIYKNWHWITFAVSCSYFFKLIEVVVSAQPLQVRQSVCVIQAIRMIHIAIFGMWRKLETQKKKRIKWKNWMKQICSFYHLDIF